MVRIFCTEVLALRHLWGSEGSPVPGAPVIHGVNWPGLAERQTGQHQFTPRIPTPAFRRSERPKAPPERQAPACTPLRLVALSDDRRQQAELGRGEQPVRPGGVVRTARYASLSSGRDGDRIIDWIISRFNGGPDEWVKVLSRLPPIGKCGFDPFLCRCPLLLIRSTSIGALGKRLDRGVQLVDSKRQGNPSATNRS